MKIVEPPLVLKTSLPAKGDMPKAFLERCVPVAGNNTRRRAQCPLIANKTDAELACEVFEEFTDIATANCFDLNDGPLRLEYFRQCLAGQARAHWDVAVNNQADDTMALKLPLLSGLPTTLSLLRFTIRSNTSYRP